MQLLPVLVLAACSAAAVQDVHRISASSELSELAIAAAAAGKTTSRCFQLSFSVLFLSHFHPPSLLRIDTIVFTLRLISLPFMLLIALVSVYSNTAIVYNVGLDYEPQAGSEKWVVAVRRLQDVRGAVWCDSADDVVAWREDVQWRRSVGLASHD